MNCLTKKRQRLRARYQKLLRQAGFRSWKRANERRVKLIDRQLAGVAVQSELRERKLLQRVADAWIAYRTNDSLGLAIRRIDRMTKKHGGRM